jgi:hypothetical protein
MLEPGEAVLVGVDLGGQDPDGDVAPEAQVLCAINLPPAAGSEDADDLVRPQSGSGGSGIRGI